MFGAIAEGTTQIEGFLEGADCLSTISCFRKMQTDIQKNGDQIIVKGKGLYGLCVPTETLDVGNSGTTTRLISGILAGQPFSSRIIGDESIQSRPMKRIITPLLEMGGNIRSEQGNDCVPLLIGPAENGLKGIDYHSPVSSAQVKSCVLLAGLYADGPTSVTEPVLSRNHTELMLKGFGADVFLMSTNALSQDGQLINIDGHGNRVAALCFGPKRVIVFAGMNKIAKTLEDAYSRARNTAAPINAKRVSSFFEINTPCLNSGSCADCKSSSSICSQIVTTRLCWPSKRITVILINDNLGY